MMNLTITTSREVENVYRDFENLITESVFDARLNLEIDQQTDEPNISFDFADFELPLGTKPKITFQYDLEKHIQELDEVFENTINKFRKHLINQIKQYGASNDLKVKAFFLNHKDHYKKYLPENRKNDICIQIVAYCNFPDATPKGYILTDSEKELAKRVYETYSHNYNKLNKVIEELNQEFLTGDQITIPKLKDNSELKAKAENTLKVLAGRWINGEKIMTDDQYIQIIRGVFCLIDTGEVLQIEKPIIQKASMQFIRRLFWTIHNELYTAKSNMKDSFIDFLHSYFECFKESHKRTTNNNFKDYRDTDFDIDYEKVLQSIEK